MKKYIVAATTLVVRLYRKSPIKPFKSLLRRLYFFVVGDSNFVQKCIYGINYELDLREVIDSQIFYSGSREPDTSKTLELLCKKGDLVLDIGANVGSHTLPIARMVSDCGEVIAFEPVPWAIRKLKRNLSLNKFQNVKLEQIALSDENRLSEEMEFRASFRIEAGQGVDKQGKINDDWWQQCEHVSARLQTLDSYVVEHGLRRVKLIKLDVDGFEGKVLRGAQSLLARDQPILIMEVAPAWLEMRGDSALAVMNQLLGLGYRCFTEVSFNEHTDIHKLIQEIPPNGGVNLVFATQSPNRI